MTKKDLKEMKVTTYTDKVHLLVRWLNHKNSMIKCVLLGAILRVYSPRIFSGMHVSENKRFRKNLCWSMGLIFTLKSEE